MNLHSSSRSKERTPPPNNPLKKPSFGGSGISIAKNSSPIISGRLELRKTLFIIKKATEYLPKLGTYGKLL